ncbi:hypothetical protein [Arsukibacterium sp.]|uniref:hypothetical protein n=1 Tax=Arsukibacterium sp. TaxID=1977258 RepID=UPI002FD90966
MLLTLAKQQRRWTIPLMVSLAFSWCMMFCSGLMQLATAAESATPDRVAAAPALPPCHSRMSVAPMDATDTVGQLVNGNSTLITDDSCFGCESAAVTIAALELPPLLLWLEAVTALTLDSLPAQQHSLYLAQGPPYPRTTPLYLQKSLLLI